jgi:PAS domain S-box-containing protein
MLGYGSSAEMEGLTLEGSSEPSFERAAFLVQLAQEGEIRGREAELFRRDGTRIIVLENARAIRSESGRLLYFEGTLEDITERTRAAERLRASEERYRRLFEDAHDAILTYDLDGRVTSLNKTGERVLGYSRSEVVGNGISEFVSADDVTILKGRIAQLLAGAPCGPRETTIKSRDGSLSVLEVSSRLVFEGGRPVGVCTIAHDITERKHWEEELQRKNIELAAALVAAREGTEAKSRFLANMSHEIRTPMNGVIGIIELLLRTPLNAEQRDYAESVKRSGVALLQLLNDILDFSKIEAGKLEVRPVLFNPASLAAEVRTLLRPQAESKGIELRVNTAPALPRQVRADESRVRQVLINLAGNAAKFTDDGWVEIRVSMEDGRLRFEVQDTGPGIAPERSGELFESFSQADTSLTRRHDGTGLGLAISKQLVALMGGEIGFDSQPGEGSTFWFTIPVEMPTDEAEPVASALRVLSRTAPAATRPVRLLLAEDNELNRRIALRMLAALGWHADSVPNGQLAVQAVLSSCYSAVLMDVHMPEMDGFTATREIRRLEPEDRHTPIIAMTANAMVGDREKCLEAGMDDYLSKPVQLDELRGAVLRWVSPAPANLVALSR